VDRAAQVALVLAAACGGGHARIDAVAGDVQLDGAPMIDDAALDGGARPDAAPQCTAGGLPGSCIEMSACYGSRLPTAGLCPGSAGIQCCTPRFADDITCDPDAVPEPNAGIVEEPGTGGCPSGMLAVTTFCIDRFEASLMLGSAAWSPYFDPHGQSVRAVSLRGAVPQGYIRQTDAASACTAAGKRLCTDDEWLRACQGPAMTTYPYGDTREPGVCNDARAVHPAVELYGTSDSWIFSHLDSPCLNQEAMGLDRTGAQTGCTTAEGAYDMMGNLHEWTADGSGTFRGGYYVDTVENGNGCLYATTAHDVSYDDYSTGFRCCADLEPG
jgi:hypothetical protein